MSLGEGDSRNPFPKTPGPMLTRRLKPDGYSKVKGRGKTISRARKIMSSAQKIIRSAPRRREKRMARAIFWGATVFRNAANGPEKFQFRIAILARGVCAKSLDVSFVAPSNPRGRHGPRFAPTGTWSRDLRLILRDVTPQIVGGTRTHRPEPRLSPVCRRRLLSRPKHRRAAIRAERPGERRQGHIWAGHWAVIALSWESVRGRVHGK